MSQNSNSLKSSETQTLEDKTHCQEKADQPTQGQIKDALSDTEVASPDSSTKAAEVDEPSEAAESEASSPSTAAQELGIDKDGTKSAELSQPLPSDTAAEQKKKKSTAEHFSELRSSIEAMRYELDEVTDFVRVATKKLTYEAEDLKFQAISSVLETLFRIHDVLFTRTIAMEASAEKPDLFTMNLLEMLEGQLRDHHGVTVIRPQPGDSIDVKYMKMLSAVPCRFWRKSETVARVYQCGFERTDEAKRTLVLRKAHVDIYRNQ